MRWTATTLVASLSWTACSAAGPPLLIEAGKPFNLRAGESAQTSDQALRVGFDGVTADSRCPKGEQCVSAGDAIARVWLQQGFVPRETRNLHTAPGSVQRANAFGHELRLVQLDPAPISGRTIDKSHYIATLTLTRGSTDAPDR